MENTAKSAVSAVSGITQGAAGAISGLWTGLGAAVGSFLGTLLGGGGGLGKTEGNWIHESRNFLADIRNWFFSAGSGFGGASYEFITGHIGKWLGGIKGSIDETRGALGSDLDIVNGYLRSINDTLGNLRGAQRGYVSRTTELIVTHGTPANPEYVARESDLRSLLPPVRENDLAGKAKQMIEIKEVRNEVHLNGQIITDREYTRQRLIPEILNALESNFQKSKLQTRLGVA
jgi:phage-related protein